MDPNSQSVHRAVLPAETLEHLAPRSDGVYIDGTVGGATMSEDILRKLGPAGRLLGIDQDPEALARAKTRLAEWAENLTLAHGNFRDMATLAEAAGIQAVNGIILDLGTSSDQLDTAERGFSFMKNGPLDMRMNPTAGPTAADWVNQSTEEDMVHAFRTLGEEPKAKRIAAAIATYRAETPFTHTLELADLIESTVGRPKGRAGRIHPATKAFQAIRIAINEELESLADALESAVNLLVPGGRLLVITFHSLEDRMVKQFGVKHVGKDVSLALGGSEWEGLEPRCKWIGKRGWTPSDEEIEANPRSRSARLRVLERLPESASAPTSRKR